MVYYFVQCHPKGHDGKYLKSVKFLDCQGWDSTLPVDRAGNWPPSFEDRPSSFGDKAGAPTDGLCPSQHRVQWCKTKLLHSAHTTGYHQKAVALCQLEALSLKHIWNCLKILMDKSKKQSKVSERCLWADRKKWYGENNACFHNRHQTRHMPPPSGQIQKVERTGYRDDGDTSC